MLSTQAASLASGHHLPCPGVHLGVKPTLRLGGSAQLRSSPARVGRGRGMLPGGGGGTSCAGQGDIRDTHGELRGAGGGCVSPNWIETESRVGDMIL